MERRMSKWEFSECDWLGNGVFLTPKGCDINNRGLRRELSRTV